jgi:hypothetical protein
MPVEHDPSLCRVEDRFDRIEKLVVVDIVRLPFVVVARVQTVCLYARADVEVLEGIRRERAEERSVCRFAAPWSAGDLFMWKMFRIGWKRHKEITDKYVWQHTV